MRILVARTTALFLAAFSLLNQIGGIISPSFNANLWWIDLRLLPPVPGQLFLGILAGCLAWYGCGQKFPGRWSYLPKLVFGIGLLICFINAIQFLVLYFQDQIFSSFPIPFSIFPALAFFYFSKTINQQPVEISAKRKRRVAAAVACVLLFGFPFLQLFCFGKTDYTRKADAAVVLGARAYADGTLSDALADRVRTGCRLYKEGKVDYLIFSGGPGDGQFTEPEAMRLAAVKWGVPKEAIILDNKGLNTQKTVANTVPLFKENKFKRVLVVSHYFHLPRTKMAYQRVGRQVFTVPAEETYILRQTPYLLARETVAWWRYYIRPLV